MLSVFGQLPGENMALGSCDAIDRDELETRLLQLRARYDARLQTLQQEHASEAEAIWSLYVDNGGGGSRGCDTNGGLLVYSPANGWQTDAAPGSAQADTKKRPRDSSCNDNAAGQTVRPSASTPGCRLAAADTMPNFSCMGVAELKKRVKGFGMKVSGKKAMVRQLTDIWERQCGALKLSDSTPDSSKVHPQASATAHSASKHRGKQQHSGTSSETNVAACSSGVDRALALQVCAFVMARPEWYTTILLLDAVDMRALHAALSVETAADARNTAKCSLKQLELILREQALCFQADKTA